MKKNIKLYVLIDPLTCKVRYIGITTQSIERRLYKHVTETMYSKKSTHKINWIRKLLSQGYSPIIKKLIDINSWETALRIEKELIKKYKLLRNLTNNEDYVDGAFKRIITDDQKKNASKKAKDFYEKGGKVANCRKIKCFKLDGSFVQNFESMSEAANILNISLRHIHLVVTGKKPQVKGYIFTDIINDDPVPITFDSHWGVKKKIDVLDLETGIHTIYNSQTELANVLNVSIPMITYYLKNPSSLKNKKITLL